MDLANGNPVINKSDPARAALTVNKPSEEVGGGLCIQDPYTSQVIENVGAPIADGRAAEAPPAAGQDERLETVADPSPVSPLSKGTRPIVE